MPTHDPTIEVLYINDCPNAEAAIGQANAVAGTFGLEAPNAVCVESEEQASAIGFLGSPSIHVNGVDVASKADAHGVMACRIYEAGCGVPPKWMLEAAVLRAIKPRGLLFLCVANSARSQLAEAIARSMAPADVTIWSAGSQPTNVRPEAKAVLGELNIDSSMLHSKAVRDIPSEAVDIVITLCAEEECPVFLGKATRLYWGLTDPAGIDGDDKHRLAAFRQTRDELLRRLGAVFPQG